MPNCSAVYVDILLFLLFNIPLKDRSVTHQYSFIKFIFPIKKRGCASSLSTSAWSGVIETRILCEKCPICEKMAVHYVPFPCSSVCLEKQSCFLISVLAAWVSEESYRVRVSFCRSRSVSPLIRPTCSRDQLQQQGRLQRRWWFCSRYLNLLLYVSLLNSDSSLFCSTWQKEIMNKNWFDFYLKNSWFGSEQWTFFQQRSHQSNTTYGRAAFFLSVI